MAKLFVTGGAGYIGSHFCKLSARKGYEPLVFDNLSTGHKKFVKYGPFIEGDIRNIDELSEALRISNCDTVVHFAAKALVGESVEFPELYESNNVQGTRTLLLAMKNVGIKNLLFSSSCSVYGVSEEDIQEDQVMDPINPYGQSKLQCEKDIQKSLELGDLQSVKMLRYFNVFGQDPEGDLWEDHEPETHLVPNIIKAIRDNKAFEVLGDDYPTPDGTCVRDFIDVCDLTRAHLHALVCDEKNFVYNVGSGSGYSIKEIIAACEEVFDCRLKTRILPRRPGDPPRLVADISRFKAWYPYPRKSLRESLESLIPRL